MNTDKSDTPRTQAMAITVEESQQRGCLRVADLKEVAQLERELNEAKTKLQEYKTTFFSHPAIIEVHRERDAWRARAERLAEQLDHADSGHSIVSALAEFDKLKEGK